MNSHERTLDTPNLYDDLVKAIKSTLEHYQDNPLMQKALPSERLDGERLTTVLDKLFFQYRVSGILPEQQVAEIFGYVQYKELRCRAQTIDRPILEVK